MSSFEKCFEEFLDAVSKNDSPKTVLADGLRKVIETIAFVKPEGFAVYINNVKLFFTNPVADASERYNLLAHYRFFANEFFLRLEVVATAFLPGLTVNEPHLLAKKNEFLSLIERCLNGDPQFAQHLNLAAPETALGERFVEIMVIYYLETQPERGDLTVDFVVQGYQLRQDGTAEVCAVIYDTFRK